MDGDLFPGFAAKWFNTEAGRIFARVGGSGPPLVLLHGFPQTHVMWHRVAPALARRFTVVAMDLRGYGWSSAPRSEGGAVYTKREMAGDVVAVMETLGHVRFRCAGHDRGGRVAYRLALDHPGRIEKLALLDILPTYAQWQLIEAGTGAAPHWVFLAKPEPQPEQEIGRNPVAYAEGLMAKWSKSGLRAFDARAMAAYRQSFSEPSRIHAYCEDYRAGAGSDRRHDAVDLAEKKTIACPLHVICGDGYLSIGETPVAVWRKSFAPQATGIVLDAGHFVAEEAPEETLRALEGFL